MLRQYKIRDYNFRLVLWLLVLSILGVLLVGSAESTLQFRSAGRALFATGYAYAGKSEQIDQIELVTRTPLPVVYGDLIAHQSAGDVFSLVMTYDDPQEDKIYTVTVPSCTLVGVAIEAGENNAGSQTTIKVLPEGGKAANMPAVTETARN